MTQYTITTYNNKSQTALVLTDNGQGGLLWGGAPISGSVNYSTGEIRIDSNSLKTAIADPQYSDYQLTDGASATNTVSGFVKTLDVQVLAPSSANVSTIASASTRPISKTIDTGFNTFDVLQDAPLPRAALLNSWVFEIGGIKTIEKNGVLYQNHNYATGEGNIVGSLNVLGELRLNGALNQSPSVKIIRGAYVSGSYQMQQFAGRLPLSPIKPQSFVAYADLGDTALQGKAGADENLSGSITGKINSATGFFKLQTSQPVAPDSLRFNAVSQSTVPLDASIIGINATRLPNDGKVPIFKRGDMIVISNAHKQNIGSAHSAWQTVQLQRQNLDRLCVKDAEGKPIDAKNYTYDLEKGTLTWQGDLDLSGYKMPIETVQWWEEENRITDTDISGSLKLQFGISRDYPKENTYVSSALLGGDLLVRATEPFSQKAWTENWQDTRAGDAVLAQLNVADYPIELTSAGAVNERWLIKFTTSTQFQLFGERLGLVAESDIYSNLAPVNPATQKPYFKLPSAAFGGGGFNAQNCIRFNTYGTPMPVWVLRAVQPSAEKAQGKQSFALCLRGNTVEM